MKKLRNTQVIVFLWYPCCFKCMKNNFLNSLLLFSLSHSLSKLFVSFFIIESNSSKKIPYKLQTQIACDDMKKKQGKQFEKRK